MVTMPLCQTKEISDQRQQIPIFMSIAFQGLLMLSPWDMDLHVFEWSVTCYSVPCLAIRMRHQTLSCEYNCLNDLIMIAYRSTGASV